MLLFVVLFMFEVNIFGLVVIEDIVKVGILYFIIGIMVISEIGLVQVEKLVIEQINVQGGVFGCQIEYVQEDGVSDWLIFVEKVCKLLCQDDVVVIFGCWIFVLCKVVLLVIEQFNGMFYYLIFYEGFEQFFNVIYIGQEVIQQIFVGIDWVVKEKGVKIFYLFGFDYIWLCIFNKIVCIYIEKKGLKVVGEEYYLFGYIQFNLVINKIKLCKLDVIFVFVVGGFNVVFYKQMKVVGVDFIEEDLLLLIIFVIEDEICGIGGENVEGVYVFMKYFQSLDNFNNKEFVVVFKEWWGDDMVIGDVIQVVYLGLWLWKVVVEKVGFFDVDKICEVFFGIEFKKVLEGYVCIYENYYLWFKICIGVVQINGQYKVVYEIKDLMELDFFFEGYK